MSTSPSVTEGIFDDASLDSALDTIALIVQESDRGAVLVAAAVVDDFLRDSLRYVAPAHVGKKWLDGLLEHPGPLSRLSARADACQLMGLISPGVHGSISALRRLRNAVAHSPATFRLAAHRSALQTFKALGPSTGAVINRFSNETVWRSFLGRLETRLQGDSDGDPPIEMSALVQRAIDSEKVMAALQVQADRAEVAFAACFVCASVCFGRKRYVEIVGGSPAFLSWQ